MIISNCSTSSGSGTYTGTVGRLAGLFVVLAHFVKVVLVELAHEAGEVAVLEVLRQDGLGELFALQDISCIIISRREEGEEDEPPGRRSCLCRLPI